MSEDNGRNEHRLSRREVLGIAGAGVLLGGGRLLRAQTPRGTEGEDPARRQAASPPPPADELVNTLAFEREAERALSEARFGEVAGSDREAFERMTFRPRMNVPVLDLDLGVDLFGQRHFSPVLVGPVAEQGRYHEEGELATARGAGAAHAGMVVGLPTTVPIGRIAQETDAPLWCGVYCDDPEAPQRVRAGVEAGAGAVLVTVGAMRDDASGGGIPARESAGIDWDGVEAIREESGGGMPVLLKGVMEAGTAEEAIARGLQGLVISNHGGVGGTGGSTPMEVLPSIAETVAGRVPILIDGSFRRGTDVLKALILGANGVLLGRPTMWGLAAYGADGVRLVVELVQHELARSIAMLGVERPDQLTPDHIRLHNRVTR